MKIADGTQKQINRIGDLLKAAYPELFLNPAGPLTIGIKDELKKLRPKWCTKKILFMFLRQFTDDPKYLRLTIDSSQRYGINGKCEPVTGQQKQYAKERLLKQRSMYYERLKTKNRMIQNRPIIAANANA